jgi:hypothetical protein
LLKAYPLTVPVTRPLVLVKPISGEWLSGFVSGDGGFNCSIFKSKYGKTGYR